MARSELNDLKTSLSKALRQVAQVGSASLLAPVWKEAVGPGLASHARPVRLVDGQLTVSVRPEFAAILAAEEAILRERLNARLGPKAVQVIHFVAEGMDTGPRIIQRSFKRAPGEGLDSIEARVHALEHIWYPRVLAGLLDEEDRL